MNIRFSRNVKELVSRAAGFLPRRTPALLALALFVAGASRAQAPLWGTQDPTYTFVPAQAFQPKNPDTTSGPYFQYIYRVGGGTTHRAFWAPVTLPSGARLTRICAFWYDDHVTANVRVSLGRAYIDGQSEIYQYLLTLSSQDTPLGYQSLCGDLDYTFLQTTPTASGEAQVTHLLEADLEIETVLRFGGVRLEWELQTSPAPSTATFADVPTNHQFFAAIEALAASGITSGCGGADFCPNQPLTRGQMAVFLAKALGLHWPN